jgi:tripartite-type tricarboxylate transporter receptor subunit TctC
MLLSIGIALLAAALVLGGCAQKTAAPKYPTKPVTIIVPSAVGGTADIHARLIAPYLEKVLGQQVVVVNKPGAGSMLGHREIAHSKPDGYTIGIAAIPESPVNVAVHKDAAGYKNEDFAILGSFTRMPGALQVMADAPFKTMQDFVAYAKANPGKLTVGVSSDGWLLATLALEDAFNIKLNPISVKSGGEGNNQLMGKHIMAHMGGAPFAVTGADKGVVALAVTGGKRMEKLPNVPTIIESGQNVTSEMIKMIVAPKGTPDAVVETLRKALKELANNPEFAKKVEGSGETFSYLDKPDLEKYYKEACDRLKAQVEKHRKAFDQK